MTTKAPESHLNRPLSGRRAIVAGGAGAIASVIAKTLAEAEAEVTVLDVSIKTVASDPTLKAQQLELTDVDALRRTVAEIGGDTGLDIVVHAAGIHCLKPFEELPPEDWDTLQAVNLRSAFLLCSRPCLTCVLVAADR